MSLPQIHNPDAHLGLPAPRLHPLGRLFIFGLGALAMQVALTLVVVAGVATAARVSQQPLDETVRDFLSRFGLWLNLVIYPPLFLWLWFCRGTLDRRSLASLGLRTPNGLGLLGLGALGGACAVGFLFGVLWLARQVAINGTSPEAFDAGAARIILLLLAYAGLFFAVGFMEELVFRGYLLHNIAAFSSPRIAIWAQAVAFALIHLGNIGMQSQSGGAEATQAATGDALRAMPGLILVGAVFAMMYLKTGSLWFPIGFHAGWNFFLGCIFSLPVSGISIFRLLDVSAGPNAWLTGGSFGAEGSVLLLPILAAMWWLLRTQPDHPQARLDLAVLRPDVLNSMVVAIEPQRDTWEPSTIDANGHAVGDESEPHQSRYKTSMRAQETDVVAPPIVWGQLPRPQAPSPVPMPAEVTATPVAAATADQSTLTAPLGAVVAPAPTLPRPDAAGTPSKTPETLTSAPPKPTVAPTPPARPAPDVSQPTPRKPAPRW